MDWNNDGKKDLVTGERDGYVRIYQNVGTDASPVFNGYVYLKVCGTNWQSLSTVPEVVDWNNDGLKDVLCGEDSGRIYLMLNSGTSNSPVFNTVKFITNGTAILNVGRVPSPTVVDWNRDGKKDLILGNVNGYVYYFQNKGTDADPIFNGYELCLAGGSTIEVGSYSQTAVTDWDNDGRWDVLCGAYEGTDDAHVWYFHAPAGPYLTTYSTAGANYEPGTTFNLVCTLKNTPAAAVTNVSAMLLSASPWCDVIQPAWTVGDMPASSTRANSTTPFVLRIKTNALLGATVTLNLAIQGNGGDYRNTNQIRLEVAKPVFSLVGYLVNDSQGNGNCAFESGERGQLVLRLKNSGYRAENVTGRLSYAYGFNVTHPTSSFGTMERNATNSNAALPFGLTALSYVPALPYFYLDVTCDRAAFTNQIYVDVLPEYPRSNGVSFAWVDTTGGTTLTLANDGYAMVSLPSGFYFPLYQYTVSYLYLSANGYLGMLSSSVANNTVIPNASSPSGILAPFWDDLDPSAGGVVRYKSFGTSPNRYLVAEWNNVPRRADAATRVTFEAILHENGDIKFQYGSSTGVNADGRSATIGIEDYTGANGVQYAFNRVGAVSNGLALHFRCSAASEDSDGDSLPDVFERFSFGGLAASGSDDSDGDGLCNLAEFRCGTDPRAGGSRLCCQPVQLLSQNRYVVRWGSIPGRSYRVWQNTNLGAASWTLLTPTALQGAATGINAYTGSVSTATARGFWRVTTP